MNKVKENIVLIGAGMMAVGTFLPFSIMSFWGETQIGKGIFSTGMGAIIIICAIVAIISHKFLKQNVITMLAGLVGLLTIIFMHMDAFAWGNHRFIGWYVMLIGAAIVTVVSLMTTMKNGQLKEAMAFSKQKLGQATEMAKKAANDAKVKAEQAKAQQGQTQPTQSTQTAQPTTQEENIDV